MRSLFSVFAAALFFAALPAQSFAQQSREQASRVHIAVDKSAQQMVVRVDGVQRHVWPVSTGRLGHDTPAGSFRAFRLERDHFSREWDDAPMPHSIFFTKRGHAIHGSLDVNRIGTPASAGCVRLAPEHAATLFELVEERGVLNTTVAITGDMRVALARTQTQAARTAPARRAPAVTQRETEPPAAERLPPGELDAYAARMRGQYERDRFYGEPGWRQRALREQALRQQALREQALREQSLRAQAWRERGARGQGWRDPYARGPAYREPPMPRYEPDPPYAEPYEGDRQRRPYRGARYAPYGWN